MLNFCLFRHFQLFRLIADKSVRRTFSALIINLTGEFDCAIISMNSFRFIFIVVTDLLVIQIIIDYHLLLFEKSIPKMKPIPKLIRIGIQFKWSIFIDLLIRIIPKSLSQAAIKTTIAIKQSVCVIVIAILFMLIIFLVFD